MTTANSNYRCFNQPPTSCAVADGQQGAALLIAMVILFMITMLGISVMQSSSVETQLATNTLAKETTFQSAESSTDAILSVPNVLADVVCRSIPNVTGMSTLDVTDNQATQVSVAYGGLAITPGFEISDKFSTYRFFITGESSIDDMSTQTKIVKGHSTVGPSVSGSGC